MRPPTSHVGGRGARDRGGVLEEVRARLLEPEPDDRVVATGVLLPRVCAGCPPEEEGILPAPVGPEEGEDALERIALGAQEPHDGDELVWVEPDQEGSDHLLDDLVPPGLVERHPVARADVLEQSQHQPLASGDGLVGICGLAGSLSCVADVDLNLVRSSHFRSQVGTLLLISPVFEGMMQRSILLLFAIKIK